MSRPRLLTFDVFGTILDWRTGLEASCQAVGRSFVDGEFDLIVDAQGSLEQGDFIDYATVTQRSLIQVLGLDTANASAVAATIGSWPLYADSSILKQVMERAHCAAMTNSDRHHGQDIQSQMGYALDTWLCSEEIGVYKPDPQFWHHISRIRNIKFSKEWWHVSAYADYDLDVANMLGLTTIFLSRPHSRPGPADHTISSLDALRDLVD